MEAVAKCSNLVLPKGFVELDREEMTYVDGGFYITNNQLWGILSVCAINPIGATLLGLGVYKLARWITIQGGKLGAKIGGAIGGAVGAVAGALLGLAAVGGIALKFADALVQGKGLDVGLKYTWFGWAYWFYIDVK